MNRKKRIWGRDFNLEVIFDVYNDEEILDSQKKALEAFWEADPAISSSCEALKKYCIEKDGDLIRDSIDNIFKYVIPVSLLVQRDEEKRSVALLCNYRFDEEHGLALFFENEELEHIGLQDDI